MRLLITEQGVLGRWGEAVQQALGPLNPAVGDGGLAPKVCVVVGQPDGDSCGGTGIVGLTEETVGSLSGIDSGGVVFEPPARHA
jgi:hypothetical protein